MRPNGLPVPPTPVSKSLTHSAAKTANQTYAVKVKPNARASSLVYDEAEGIWLATLKALPIDGKANEELIALFAKQMGCCKSAVTIKSGASGRMKLVRVES